MSFTVTEILIVLKPIASYGKKIFGFTVTEILIVLKLVYHFFKEVEENKCNLTLTKVCDRILTKMCKKCIDNLSPLYSRIGVEDNSFIFY